MSQSPKASALDCETSILFLMCRSTSTFHRQVLVNKILCLLLIISSFPVFFQVQWQRLRYLQHQAATTLTSQEQVCVVHLLYANNSDIFKTFYTTFRVLPFICTVHFYRDLK